jgi:hypothetical protein
MGTPVLSYSIKTPKIDVNKSINDFYKEIEISCLNWIKETLYTAVCEEYKNYDDKNKRFRFGYRYLIECKVVFAENDTISVIINTELKKKGDKLSLEAQRYAQVWRISSGELLPICSLANKKTLRKYRKIKSTGYYISQKGLYAITKENGDVCLFCH